jgi:hypothetical protein
MKNGTAGESGIVRGTAPAARQLGRVAVAVAFLGWIRFNLQKGIDNSLDAKLQRAREAAESARAGDEATRIQSTLGCA